MIWVGGWHYEWDTPQSTGIIKNIRNVTDWVIEHVLSTVYL